jgi:hypothetical protein
VKYDERMDPECVQLCDALNALPGIRTFESCCGHGQHEFCVWFFADQVQSLLPLEQSINRWEWTIKASHVDCPTRVVFLLEGTSDPAAGNRLADEIRATQRT